MTGEYAEVNIGPQYWLFFSSCYDLAFASFGGGQSGAWNELRLVQSVRILLNPRPSFRICFVNSTCFQEPKLVTIARWTVIRINYSHFSIAINLSYSPQSQTHSVKFLEFLLGRYLFRNYIPSHITLLGQVSQILKCEASFELEK